MPTAAAVAIAATTAKIQAMDAQQAPAALVRSKIIFQMKCIIYNISIQMMIIILVDTIYALYSSN